MKSSNGGIVPNRSISQQNKLGFAYVTSFSRNLYPRNAILPLARTKRKISAISVRTFEGNELSTVGIRVDMRELRSKGGATAEGPNILIKRHNRYTLRTVMQ
jgi:hypothetical protein